MCGRTALFLRETDLLERFDATLAPETDYRPRYNIAPGSHLEVIAGNDEIEQYTWGFVPPWESEGDRTLINARSESVMEKRPFQNAWADRPCLVLTSGFYEWQTVGQGPKQPYRIWMSGTEAFALAGLWERDDNGTQRVTILTTDAREPVASVHDRMPVVLNPEDEDEWLRAPPAERATICAEPTVESLKTTAISQAINNPRNDDPSVIEPASDVQSGLGEFAE